MKRSLFLVAFLAVLSLVAVGADSAEALRHADREFCRDTRAHGLEGWLQWFADDASLPQQSPPVVGKAALRDFYKQLFSRSDLDFSWQPDHAQSFPSGHLGYTSGRYSMAFTRDGKKVHNTGSYLTVWKKQADGSWKVLSDFGAPDAKPATK